MKVPNPMRTRKGSAMARSELDENAEWCRRCGQTENPAWFAASPLWNAVMRGGSIAGESDYEDMVCLSCFTALAEERGIASCFRLTAEIVNVELETATPGGRVWDEDRFLWVDPAPTDPNVNGELPRNA